MLVNCSMSGHLFGSTVITLDDALSHKTASGDVMYFNYDQNGVVYTISAYFANGQVYAKSGNSSHTAHVTLTS